jgi:glycosyltransferase involved in cell wall biosynthesis
MHVLFVAQYGLLAASSRTRVFDYLPLLRQSGVVADVVVVAPDKWVRRLNAGGVVNRLLYYWVAWFRTWCVGIRCLWSVTCYDALFIQKVIFPSPISKLLRRYRHKILFDFDDAIFTVETVGTSWLSRIRHRRRQRGLPAMLQTAQCAVVENAYTADYAQRFCPQVVRITGPIDTVRYAPGERLAKDEVVLGWIGSPTTTQYLDLIRDSLAELGRRYPLVKLHLIGASSFQFDGMPVESFAWRLDTEVAHLCQFDIGLMPLPDDDFTRGKGGYKLLQYMAMGLPVVASPVEINREIVDHGKNGFCADSLTEWVQSLSLLIEDAELRKRLGMAGRKKMERDFSLQSSSQRLLHILQSFVQVKKG